MKKLLILLFFFPLFALAQTCDVDLIGYDPETHEVSVAILNGENCGCNEYTTTRWKYLWAWLLVSYCIIIMNI